MPLPLGFTTSQPVYWHQCQCYSHAQKLQHRQKKTKTDRTSRQAGINHSAPMHSGGHSLFVCPQRQPHVHHNIITCTAKRCSREMTGCSLLWPYMSTSCLYTETNNVNCIFQRTSVPLQALILSAALSLRQFKSRTASLQLSRQLPMYSYVSTATFSAQPDCSIYMECREYTYGTTEHAV